MCAGHDGTFNGSVTMSLREEAPGHLADLLSSGFGLLGPVSFAGPLSRLPPPPPPHLVLGSALMSYSTLPPQGARAVVAVIFPPYIQGPGTQGQVLSVVVTWGLLLVQGGKAFPVLDSTPRNAVLSS